MNPTRRIRPPHPSHLSANTPYLRASNCAKALKVGTGAVVLGVMDKSAKVTCELEK